jgi:hypothetical protein
VAASDAAKAHKDDSVDDIVDTGSEENDSEENALPIPGLIRLVIFSWDLIRQNFFEKLCIFLVLNNMYGIPKSFNTNISHQLFDNTITFVNSQH